VWLRRWSPRLGRELAEARRVGARAEELSAIRDILYEDKWFRIATAVYVHLKKLFAEDGKAGELLEAAERRLYGLRLEVVEAPLLKIEAAVDQDGRVAAVRCRAALDLGVEAVFEGTAPGYKLEEAAGAEAALDKRRGEEEGWVGRLLEEVKRGFSGLPVYVGVEEGYVKRTAPMDKRQFKRYLETCRRLGFRFDRGQAAGGVVAISSGINLHQTPHRPRMSLLYGQAGGGGGRVSAPPQKRWAFPPHARRRLGVVEVVRDAAAKRRYTPSARGGRPSRRQGGGRQLDRSIDKPTPRPTKLPTAKNGVLSRLSSFLPPLRGAEEWRLDFTQRRMK
jgi:hypothetical protein